MSRRQTYFGHLFDAVFGDDAFQRHAFDAKAWIVAHLLTGATNGLTVGQHCVGATPAPNLTVDVSPGVAYDNAGNPATLAAIANVDCSADHIGASTDPASGNHLVASIFMKWADVPSVPFTDHAGASGYQTHDDGCTFEVWKGAEVALATPASGAPLMAGYVLLADVTLTHGMTQIVPGRLHLGRRQNLITAPGTDLVLSAGTIGAAFAQLVTWLDDHVRGANSRHPASDVDGTGVYGTPYSLGYVGTTLVGGTVQSFLASLVTQLNSVQRCARVHLTAGYDEQTVHSAGLAAIDWLIQDYNVGSMLPFGGGGGTQIPLAPVAAKYHVSATLAYGISSPSTGILEAQIVRHSDGKMVAYTSVPVVGAADTVALNVAGDIDLAAGDYCEVKAYQTTGGDLGVWGTACAHLITTG